MKDLHEQGYPVELGCDVVELPRSSYYYQACASRDATVIPVMKAIAGEYPTYGIRHMTQQLRRPPHALVLNHKRVARLMGQAGLPHHQLGSPLSALPEPGQNAGGVCP